MEDNEREENIRRLEAMTEAERAQYALNPRFRRLNFFLRLSGALIAAGTLGVLGASTRGTPVHAGELTAFSAYYSLPLLAVFLLFAFPSMRARSGWDRSAGLLFLMAVAGFLLCGAAVARIWDYAMDLAAPARYEAVITDGYRHCGRHSFGNCSYYIEAVGGPRGEEYTLQVPRAEYETARKGGRYSLYVTPGALGFEWLHAYCPAP